MGQEEGEGEEGEEGVARSGEEIGPERCCSPRKVRWRGQKERERGEGEEGLPQLPSAAVEGEGR